MTPTWTPDHWLIVTGGLLGLALLGYTIWEAVSGAPSAKAHNEASRIRLLRLTSLLLWGMSLIAGIAWILSGRGFAILGPGSGWGAALAWGVAALVIAYLGYCTHRLKTDPEECAKTARHLEKSGGLEIFMPQTRRGYRYAQLAALSAGPTEEFLLRAFAITTLALFLPVWAAAGIAGLGFMLLHLYQGWRGVLRTGPITLVLTLMYLVSDSILPGILLHSAVDMIGVAQMQLLLKARHKAAATGTPLNHRLAT
ncbi:MAG: CPBP family intramembrane glutamic endopeptidase [Rhodothalassiaceae bacterium]